MKRIAAFAVVITLALTLAGCSGGGSENGTEKESEDKTEAIQEISQEDGLREYVSNPEIKNFHSDAFEDVTSMMNSASDGDVNACEAYNTAIHELCSDVRSVDVPKGAEEYHQMMIDLAGSFENTAISFLAASHLDDPVQRMGGVAAAADTLDEVSERMDEMTDYINEKLNS